MSKNPSVTVVTGKQQQERSTQPPRRKSSDEVKNDLLAKFAQEFKEVTSENLMNVVTDAMKFVGQRANSFLKGHDKKTVVIQAIQPLLPSDRFGTAIKDALPSLIDTIVSASKGELVINEQEMESCFSKIFTACGCN